MTSGVPPFPTYEIRSPAPSTAHRCSLCLGPVGRTYALCTGCSRAWGAIPASVLRPVLPLTVALEGANPWYHALKSYKRTEGMRAWDIRHVASAFLRDNRQRVESWLGCEPDLVTVVPSKRDHAADPTTQPLYRVALRAFEDADLDWPVTQPMRYSGVAIGRQQYRPEAFQVISPSSTTLRGATVLVVDDAWVSGSTMLSLAGALHLAGARRVGLLVLSRVVRVSFWETVDPVAIAVYQAAQRPYDSSRWPLD